MSDVNHDYEIERLEAELRESQFKKWDVETLLADRHRKKIEALTAPENEWVARWQVAKEIGHILLSYVGFIAITVMAGHWVLTGDILPSAKPDIVINPIPPAVLIERSE